jgi:hypothetical protein
VACGENARKNAVRILQDIVVPEADDVPPESIQIGASLSVAIVAVLSAIRFDDEAAFRACEVRNTPPDRLLPAKFETSELPIAKVTPQAPLGVSRFAAEPLRMRAYSSDRGHGHGL